MHSRSPVRPCARPRRVKCLIAERISRPESNAGPKVCDGYKWTRDIGREATCRRRRTRTPPAPPGYARPAPPRRSGLIL
ncbi:hypothetical protein EVAR_76639_1 [Eumeta japonica]|uniref:Uncharacterized protein n=1 Tax=Eumeta variegata TaxID=151549 RepID=A0A4C1T647_EUMVA|nr:hypothetical protein EVAR_76639_1 [Eumeta japonica]